MSTYPLVLIPKLLADFRQSSWVSCQPSVTNSPSSVLSAPRLIVRKPQAWLRWLAVGLAVLGILQTGTLLGGVCFGSGTLLMAWSWLRKKSMIQVQRDEIVPTIQPDAPTSLPLTLSEAEQRKAHLLQLARLMKGKVLLPIGRGNAPVGTSEERFGEILDRYFPGRVFPQQEVPIPDWSKPHNYSTDFCMAIKEVNLWIDIEIDEPYDYKTGNPTHCWDDGRDAKRNTFFLQNGWVVIRFSEEQVVHHPESCCKEIASVIKKLTGITAFYNALSSIPQLVPSPMWSKRKARAMAKAKVRDKYLNRLKLKVN
ncbi:MAG TPA: DUF559 domain-containing protein [Cyanophyceae cyanobacterium]